MSASEYSAAIVIPFRDRGIDPLRQKNLESVVKYWQIFLTGLDNVEIIIPHDGRSGDQQFNRSAAFNRGAASTDADLLTFTESDILVPYLQIHKAWEMALEAPGMVVPFDKYHYLRPVSSEYVRGGSAPELADHEWVMADGRSIGAVNVMSRETFDMVGEYDELFEGSWYDDNAMKIAFDICAAPTRWVAGSAYHLYHLPGWSGGHLTDEDREATSRNQMRLELYKRAKTPQDIRALIRGER